MTFILGLVALTGVAGGQVLALSTPADWTRVVDLYLKGQPEAAAASVLQSSPGQALRVARAAFGTWSNELAVPAAARTTTRRLQASAMLSLDLLLALAGDVEPSRRQAFETLGQEAWRRLAPAARGDDAALAEDARRVRQFRAWLQVGLLESLVTSGRHAEFRVRLRSQDIPDTERSASADRAFLAGLVEEAGARAARGTPAYMPTPGTGTELVVDEWASRTTKVTLGLEDAARSFRRVLELDPAHAEAQLHLARVLLELGRLDEAGTRLTPLAATPCGEALCGLAWLSLGELHEWRGQPDQAAMAYARASGAVAVRQAATFALIQLALRRGDTTQAFGLTAQFERGPLASNAGADGWTAYKSSLRQRAGGVQQRLKETVLP